MNLLHFDDWVSDFAETVTAIELSPEGSGYRPKTRLAKFYNLPELIANFKMAADIQTADMLKLPVPKANFHTEVIKPSALQQEAIKGLAERAEKVRNSSVDPSVDNMLKITNDGESWRWTCGCSIRWRRMRKQQSRRLCPPCIPHLAAKCRTARHTTGIL